MMIFPVSSEAARVAVTLVAALGGALERLFVPVSQQMAVEMILALERFMANIAKVFPLVAVRESMLGQR